MTRQTIDGQLCWCWAGACAGAGAAGSWPSSAAPLHRSADQVKSEKQDLSRPDASLSVLITHERADGWTGGRANVNVSGTTKTLA